MELKAAFWKGMTERKQATIEGKHKPPLVPGMKTYNTSRMTLKDIIKIT